MSTEGRRERAYQVREMYYGTREEFEYIECPSCRCLQIASIPEDLSRYYPAGYYAHSIFDERSFGTRIKAYLRRKRNRYLLFHRGVMGNNSERSCRHGLGRSLFSKEQLSEFQRRAEELNAQNRGDMAAY